MSNLSYFNRRFFFKAFPDISQNALKKLLYNNKMPTSAEQMDILKENEIRGYSHYTKSKLIDLLIKKGLIPEKYGTNEQEKAKRDIDSKYNFLRHIRRNPKKVEIHDLETDKVVLYPSIYKAALALDQNTGVIGMYDGKVWRNRYVIKVLTESESFKILICSYLICNTKIF